LIRRFNGKIFSLGHKIIHIPTLKISAANIDPVDAKKYDAFIFTSANAIRNLKLINQDKINYVFVLDLLLKKL
jgi:uroporphyrinogen-III synthase